MAWLPREATRFSPDEMLGRHSARGTKNEWKVNAPSFGGGVVRDDLSAKTGCS